MNVPPSSPIMEYPGSSRTRLPWRGCSVELAGEKAHELTHLDVSHLPLAELGQESRA